MNKEQDLLSVRRAAKALGVGINTIRNWDKSGYLKPAFRVGNLGHRRYTREQIEEIKAKRLPQSAIDS
jgi:DNA-binding transcriptional MerR regulator